MPKSDAARLSTRKSEAVRAKLLAAAAELIPELGWGSVTTRAVAERAGVAPGLVHYHFESMQDLLVHASVGLLSQLVHDAARELEGQSLSDGIRGLFASLDAIANDDPATLLVSEAYLAGSRDPHLRELLGKELSTFRSAMADWLRGHGETDAEAKAAAIAALGDGLILHGALGKAQPGSDIARLTLRMLDSRGETT
jgi:AcrR family transcriptional regulator